MKATYTVKVINIKSGLQYPLNILADTLMGALRQAKDHAQYVARWDFNDIRIELITPRQAVKND